MKNMTKIYINILCLYNFFQKKLFQIRKTVDRKYKKRASIFTWIKKFRQEKKIFKKKQKIFFFTNFPRK